MICSFPDSNKSNFEIVRRARYLGTGQTENRGRATRDNAPPPTSLRRRTSLNKKRETATIEDPDDVDDDGDDDDDNDINDVDDDDDDDEEEEGGEFLIHKLSNYIKKKFLSDFSICFTKHVFLFQMKRKCSICCSLDSAA